MREPLLLPEVEVRLFPYLVARAAQMGVYVYAINGWFDHVHLVVAIPPKHAVAEVVRQVKGASSHFLNHEVGLEQHFAWQRGYGALSIGERQRGIAEAYVARQKQHHAQQTLSARLERADDQDEGPLDMFNTGTDPSALHEANVQYDLGSADEL
jgi:putative transposase